MVKEGRESDISVLAKDSLVEILCRLGCPKYATQCKSVCKLWCSLVNTDSYWLRRWDQLNHKKLEGVTEHGLGIETPPVFVNLDFLPDPVHVVGSHKDLLLCSSSRDWCSGYYICNPFTKQWTALPPPPQQILYCHDLRAKVEFIVDERADGGLKFTVVRVIPFYDVPILSLREEKVQVSIFSSDRGWREMDGGGGWREMFQLQSQSCQKIISYKGSPVCFMSQEFSVFDGEREEFPEEVRLYGWDLDSDYTYFPPVYLDNRFTSMFTIGVCEGRLRMAQLVDYQKKLIVWQLDDSHRHEWDILQEVELDFSRLRMKDSTTASLYEREQVLLMSFLPHDGDILYMRVHTTSYDRALRKESSSHFLITYNLKRRRLELMRKLHEYIVKGTKLFPLVKNCWPTPVPLLVTNRR